MTAPAILPDTHVLIWLLTDPGRLSAAAAEVLKAAGNSDRPIRISVVSLAEILYLTEKMRIDASILSELLDLLEKSDSPFEVLAVDMDVYRAMPGISRNSVPDFPDRIIAATAVAHGLTLITRDRRILDAGLPSIEA